MTPVGCGHSTPSSRHCCAASQPEILVSQHGCDTHRIDPLAQLALTIDGQRAAHLALHDLAHEVAGGRWIAVGGGGYALAQVVPRTWTHLLAIAAGAPIDPANIDADRVAGERARPHRRTRSGIHDGRRVRRLSKFRRGPRSGRSGRPRDHGDHECNISGARASRRRFRMSHAAAAAPSRAELLEYLSVARIAGPVATPREANLANYRLMVARDPDYLFGLEPRGAWTFDDVLALMAQRCGVSPDPLYDSGADTIDRSVDRRTTRGDGRATAHRRERRRLAFWWPLDIRPASSSSISRLPEHLRSAGCTLLTPPAVMGARRLRGAAASATCSGHCSGSAWPVRERTCCTLTRQLRWS